MINENIHMTRDEWKKVALEVSDINNRLRAINELYFSSDYNIDGQLDGMYDEISDHVGHMYLENIN